jgi:hypothetical protein
VCCCHRRGFNGYPPFCAQVVAARALVVARRKGDTSCDDIDLQSGIPAVAAVRDATGVRGDIVRVGVEFPARRAYLIASESVAGRVLHAVVARASVLVERPSAVSGLNLAAYWAVGMSRACVGGRRRRGLVDNFRAPRAKISVARTDVSVSGLWTTLTGSGWQAAWSVRP